MRNWQVISVLVFVLLMTACSVPKQTTDKTDADITTEVTAQQTKTHELVANAETISAYGQLLNNACVYLNENYGDKITGDVRKEYDATCERLHNINLQGISAFAQKSDEERSELFAQLEEIERSIFDSVADKIGVKAELTEAITTTADKKADDKAVGEVITTSPVQTETAAEETERITAAD